MIQSIEDFIQEIIKIKNEWFPVDKFPEIWYRGINDSKLNLLPGAYWRTNCDEYSATATFKALTPSLLPHLPTDEWDWYFLMQHYGLPTRLLDWTESPLQALQFALTSFKDGKTPAVWIIDPMELNQLTSNSSSIFVPQAYKPKNNFEAWLPHNCYKGAEVMNDLGPDLNSNEFPLAIYPSRSLSNPRLFAQRGVFTVHGTKVISIEDLFESHKCDKLIKLEMDINSVPELLNVLFALGFNKSTTYPEPNSVSADVIRMYNIK